MNYHTLQIFTVTVQPNCRQKALLRFEIQPMTVAMFICFWLHLMTVNHAVIDSHAKTTVCVRLSSAVESGSELFSSSSSSSKMTSSMTLSLGADFPFSRGGR